MVFVEAGSAKGLIPTTSTRKCRMMADAASCEEASMSFRSSRLLLKASSDSFASPRMAQLPRENMRRSCCYFSVGQRVTLPLERVGRKTGTFIPELPGMGPKSMAWLARDLSISCSTARDAASTFPCLSVKRAPDSYNYAFGLD